MKVISLAIWISKSSLEAALRICQSRERALVPQSMRDLLSRNLLRDLTPNVLVPRNPFNKTTAGFSNLIKNRINNPALSPSSRCLPLPFQVESNDESKATVSCEEGQRDVRNAGIGGKYAISFVQQPSTASIQSKNAPCASATYHVPVLLKHFLPFPHMISTEVISSRGIGLNGLLISGEQT
jgi:hypothetical protein